MFGLKLKMSVILPQKRFHEWLREGLKKSDIYHLGAGEVGVSEGQLSLSIFFVPNALKIIS